jgi:diketogulonate reductase-like aldo/keto reductase
MDEPSLLIQPSGTSIPQLAFGLYLIPADETGVSIILNAISAGYRHFDTASYYGNERTLGHALKRSGIPRDQFFIVSKIWNDAQKNKTVRTSVERSIDAIDFGDYIDLYLIHWPVPGCFVDTYKELELLHHEGKLKHLGLSNFIPAEYEELLSIENNITVLPIVNQFEVSPFMYRPYDVSYFQQRGVLVSSSKSLNRAGECFTNITLQEIAQNHCVAPAQVMLRWGIQKGLIVTCKSSSLTRMVENRKIFHFVLSDEEMTVLDGLTTEDDVTKRTELEKERKLQM